jgi:catechol 2,3-dioxygenase-like lactoylglutathione lyase family enzyme
MLQSLNHLTLAVSDLQKSVTFWHELLGLTLHARWNTGAYLTCGDLWVCLSYDEARQYVPPQESDYTHYAFTVAEADFEPFSQRLSRRASPSGSRTKARGVVLFSRPGRAQAGAARGQPRRAAGGVSREALCGHGVYLRRGLRRTFSLPASVTCVAASS